MTNISSDLVQYRGLLLMILVLGLGGTFQYGFHISVLNSPSPYIKAFINETWVRRYGNPVPHYKQTLIWSLMVSVFSIGGLMGSTGSGYLIEKFGKKKCQLYNCLLPLASALFMGLSRTVNSYEMILVGRYLSGFYSGLGINIHAQFLGELAPRKLRGFINATGPVFVTFGKFCGQIVGLSDLFGSEAQWHQILLLSGLLSLLQLVTLPFFPESPTYLLLDKGDKDGCVRALKQLWGDTDHQSYIDEIMKEHVSNKNVKKMSSLELLKDPSLRCQLFVSTSLIVCLQLSGVSAIYFYSYDVFQEAGFPKDQIAYVSLGVGAFEFASALICSLLIDRFGRKVLIMGGYGLMILTLGLLTLSLSFQDAYIWMPYCSVFLTFLFIFLYGAGPSGATISTCVEIYSRVPRVPAFVIMGVFSWVGLYTMAMVFPYIVESLKQFSFLLFMAITTFFLIFTYFFVPETKGKTIEEISEEFKKFNFRKKSKESRAASLECTLSTRL